MHVVYGLVGLKTHTKVAMVARAEGDAVRCYCHIGTGNYNARTARTYEDIGLLTASPAIGTDVTHLFNYLTGYGRNVSYDRLLVAPERLRSGLIDLVRNERKVDGGGRIVMKMNSLADPEFIDELYAASADGVRIELIVRGICCLRTAVEGLSERIRVRSIVGRYLEHSRIFRFGNGAGLGVPSYYIGSADMMPRNLDRRDRGLDVDRRSGAATPPRLDARRLSRRRHAGVGTPRRPVDQVQRSKRARVAGRPPGARPCVDPRDAAQAGRSGHRRHSMSVVEPIPIVEAAGGMVLDATSGAPLVLLVHRPKWDDWTFPKGHVEPGRDPRRLREA